MHSSDFVISPSKAYTTHISVLVKMLEFTKKGTVLEIGGGPFSTPLLHWLCREQKRRVYTYDNIPKYYEYELMFRSKYHNIRFVEDWDKFKTGDRHFSMAFIDHLGDRAKMAVLLKDKVDYIILHDTEEDRIYGYDKIWHNWKYRYDWKLAIPWTTVLSNKKINL